MRKTVITCDHCGKKINEMIDYPDIEFDVLNESFQADLCSGCYMEIGRIIKQFCKRGCQNEKEM